MTLSGARRLAVVGAGWAGLAAAVAATRRGAQVTLFEMARQPGGRARQVNTGVGHFDNGQHILIGAYTATLDLMRSVGADPEVLLLRRPLAWADPQGQGLALPPGAPLPSFVRATLAMHAWRWPARLALLRAATGWMLGGFQCPQHMTVEHLCGHLPMSVQRELIEPLCVAALNTPMAQASGTVFLRVLRDALFSGRGSADLLLPRQPLSALLPAPAWAWLSAHGAVCLAGRRVQSLQARSSGWLVDGDPFDSVVLACSATEAARLVTPLQPAWASQANALRYEPIVTAYLRDASLSTRHPMVLLPAPAKGVPGPAQFAFDLGALHTDATAAGLWAWVASSAARALADGLPACGQALLGQARAAFPGHFSGPYDQVLVHLAAERRATFACTPELQRPPAAIAPGLSAAGDYVAGPYPATLEGAVRSGLAAASNLQ